jgi:hypothetical protein
MMWKAPAQRRSGMAREAAGSIQCPDQLLARCDIPRTGVERVAKWLRNSAENVGRFVMNHVMIHCHGPF